MSVAIVSRCCRDTNRKLSRWHYERASRQRGNPIGSLVAMRDAHDLSHEGVGGVVGASHEATSPTKGTPTLPRGGHVVDVHVEGDLIDPLTWACDGRGIPTTMVESRSRTPSNPSFVGVVQAGAGDDLRGRGRYVFIGSRLVPNRHSFDLSIPPRSSAAF